MNVGTRRLVVIGSVLTLLMVGVGIILSSSVEDTGNDVTAEIDVSSVLGGDETSGYVRADAPREFRFPEDHGPHPDFRSEWWYFTGNLWTPRDRRFGYELTIFRFALAPERREDTSQWSTNQVYMGHFSITNVEDEEFVNFERLSRGAVGLAGAQAEPFRVWIEDWSIAVSAPDPARWQISARAGDIQLVLDLLPTKPMVLQGDRGLSQKSSEPGNASYYYSFTRIETHGTLTINQEPFAVSGQSWMDREWSTSALGADQAGWDWFALQLDDGYDLMFYQLRRKDGGIDPHSRGTLVGPHGRTTTLPAQEVKIEVMDTWESPRGGHYPSQWRFEIPSAQLEFDITPVLPDQELVASVRYWEGAVDVRGRRNGAEVKGHGYVELTGYGSKGTKFDQ
jgi:predicted secreted hydrolase